jgi:hypothetical protein
MGTRREDRVKIIEEQAHLPKTIHQRHIVTAGYFGGGYLGLHLQLSSLNACLW